MTVITISRQSGSHGDTVAQLQCDRLGYRYFDKNLTLELATVAGLAPGTVADLSDEKHRARSLWSVSSATIPLPQRNSSVRRASARS